MAKTATIIATLLLNVSFSVAQLNTLAQAAGKLYFGTATDNPELTDLPYVAQLENTADFHQLTPANSMKWDATEPTRGVFTFAGGDQIVAQAQANGQIMRGHNCVWHNQLPDWVEAGDFDNATLLSIIENHCGTLVGHYAGQMYLAESQKDAWDVINEPFNDDGTFAQDVFFNTTGTSYIPTALRAARAADPNAKLYINDFNIEGTGAKSTGMANLVKQLKAEGVPIDGIGIQSHLIVGEVPTTLQQNIQDFVDLGVEVAITELDIRMTLPYTPILAAQQTEDYRTVISACKAVAGCIGVTVWDWTDKFSWVPGTFAGQGAACPWDVNLDKKPAYEGIVEGWLS
ncbi:glycoside hydrolase family 10 protein [Hypholoma sublateritium FD-334 SS-4]|uniref:Beta-xylanase n=1 Tax=Hypholoma sublateritium (strain FD-334 SS-4) TaxID=945553 RepID=A0A0D2LUJ8_HYPSF|nr:glycoside hydrolase family 10 protein [Hypholoma sublateritium FD-334 SS-4]